MDKSTTLLCTAKPTEWELQATSISSAHAIWFFAPWAFTASMPNATLTLPATLLSVGTINIVMMEPATLTLHNASQMPIARYSKRASATTANPSPAPTPNARNTKTANTASVTESMTTSAAISSPKS